MAHRDAVQQYTLSRGRHVPVLALHERVVRPRVGGRPAPRREHTLADGVDLEDLEAQVGEGARVQVAPVEVVRDARLARGVLAQRRLQPVCSRGYNRIFTRAMSVLAEAVSVPSRGCKRI